MRDDLDDDEEEFDEEELEEHEMDEQELEDGLYELYGVDLTVVKAAIELLEKILCAPFITPAKITSVSKVLYVLKRLPERSSEIQVEISLTGPRQWFHTQEEPHEVYHWWTVEVESNGLISICSAGHFYRRSTGGDTFISMQWSALPGYEADYKDFLPHLSLVDDARPFDLEVTLLDLSKPGYSISVEDEDNPLLEEEEEEEEEASSCHLQTQTLFDLSEDTSTPELTANLWAFLDSGTGLVYALAGRAYFLSGDDSEKLSTLKELSRYDFQSATRVPVPERFGVYYPDGTSKSGITTPRAVNDPDSQLFEELFEQLEKALPPLPDFLTRQVKQQKFCNDPLSARTIVFEDEAGNCRAIVTDEDYQWLAEQMES